MDLNYEQAFMWFAVGIPLFLFVVCVISAVKANPPVKGKDDEEDE